MVVLVTLNVEVPVPTPPDSGDVTEKAGDLGTWLAHQGQPFFVLLLCLAGALIVMAMLKRPFVRGLLVGLAALAVLFLAFRK